MQPWVKRGQERPGQCWAARCQQVGGGALGLCLALLRPRVESCVQLRARQWKKDVALAERVERRASKRLKGLEHPS